MSQMDEFTLRRIIKESVGETLTALGFKVNDPTSMQADLAHLHRWRMTMESAQRTSIRTTIGILVTGVVSAIWLGITTYFHR